jgi:tetraacyldisaccharide 4'-kinase
MDVRAWVARSLEGGRAEGPCAAYASRVWGRIARVERPLVWREAASVVVIGGSTLGGSGKTPLAVACAKELRRSGARVALVGHGYGASPGRARYVSAEDDVRSVGDEALACARQLTRLGVPVVVAKKRQDALDLALQAADVAVVDGPCQTSPRRATLSLLAVDAEAPWGAGHCPPRGDLRAPVEVLLAAVDRVVVVGGEGRDLPDVGPLPLDHAGVVSLGAWLRDCGRKALLEWDQLRHLRLGLWTAIARPDRILRALERHGISPKVAVLGADHSPAGAAFRGRGLSRFPALDLWLTTTKCESHLGRGPRCRHEGVPDPRFPDLRFPFAVLDHTLSLESALTRQLRKRAGSTLP